MRKFHLVMIVALTIALLGNAFTQVNSASARDSGNVGVVVAYAAGQSITIVDQSGNQHEYMLSTSLKILPQGRTDLLAVGSFVTIIAPNSISNGKQLAVGIVIHPHVPNGWTIPSLSTTPFPTTTFIATVSTTPTGTLLTTETTTPTPVAPTIVTGTSTAIETATPAPVVVFTETPTATPLGGATKKNPNSFVEWLRSLFQQILSDR